MAKRETLAEIHTRVIELESTPPQILDGARRLWPTLLNVTA